MGLFLRAKEADNLPPSAHGGPKWRKMVQFWNQLLVKDGILCRLFENVADTNAVAQLIVPNSLKKEILQGIHEDVGGGHFGVEKTAKLKERFTGRDILIMFRVGVLLVASVLLRKLHHHM